MNTIKSISGHPHIIIYGKVIQYSVQGYVVLVYNVIDSHLSGRCYSPKRMFNFKSSKVSTNEVKFLRMIKRL